MWPGSGQHNSPSATAVPPQNANKLGRISSESSSCNMSFWSWVKLYNSASSSTVLLLTVICRMYSVSIEKAPTKVSAQIKYSVMRTPANCRLLCVSKNLPLGDRLPRYGGGGACARGGAVARRAGGREPRLCPKPSCLREALSPTACGRSPLPEGAKEFFDNLSFPLRGSLLGSTYLRMGAFSIVTRL